MSLPFQIWSHHLPSAPVHCQSKLHGSVKSEHLSARQTLNCYFWHWDTKKKKNPKSVWTFSGNNVKIPQIWFSLVLCFNKRKEASKYFIKQEENVGLLPYVVQGYESKDQMLPCLHPSSTLLLRPGVIVSDMTSELDLWGFNIGWKVGQTSTWIQKKIANARHELCSSMQ